MSDTNGHARKQSFITRYIFSTDHKVIGTQFLFSTLIWLVVGGGLAIALRIQLAWPWTDMPYFGKELFATEGGQISPDFYNMLFTMHASVMIFFVIIPILAGAFGNLLIPLMIGADDMAFPKLNMLSYWFMWPAFILMGFSFATPTFGPAFGWTANPPLAEGPALSFWLLGLIFVGIASMMGSVNYLTTIIQMRAPGMTMFRLPMTIWGMFVTAILQAFALPVLTAALCMQLADNCWGTGFFRPENADVAGGGEALMWQHLFWFYSHPAVYIMILPAMGMVSDIISCFARKPLFGYKPMIYSISGIAGLGFIVWGHHMFVSGMNPYLGTTFALSTILIALPSAIKVFNWIGTLWRGNLRLTTPMLFAISFVSMFVIGGLSGIPIASPLLDIPLHDTYFIVAHIHYVLFAGTMMAVFGAIYYWYPKMFGRMMSETLGKIHFFLTFVFMNGTFFLMHVLGWMGVPRRYASFHALRNQIEEGNQQLELTASDGVSKVFIMAKDYESIIWINEFITICAIGMGVVQIFFILNFLGSLVFGKKAGRNPWEANTLEWSTPSPPGHGNFDFQPIVSRGPYEYSHPDAEQDFVMQTDPPLNSPEQVVSDDQKDGSSDADNNHELEPAKANWPFRWSVVLACITFPLIWVGGLVTTTDAGMAVPDWPNTYGYNLFLYPYTTWLSGPWDLFIEHGHRLLGSLAGFVSIILVISTFRHTQSRTLRLLAIGALALVIAQGILGGVRVLAIDRFLAKVHGCVGPAFFAYTAAFATICYRKLGHTKSQDQVVNERRFGSVALAMSLVVFSFLQLVLGANLRHIEESASFHLFRWLVLAHLVFAGIVFLLALAVWISRRKTTNRPANLGFDYPKRTSQLVVLMVLFQIGLGLTTWLVKYHWPFNSDRVTFFANFLIMEKSIWQTSIVTAHVALGSLILMSATVLAAQLFLEFKSPLVDNQPMQESTPSGVVA